jgi:predicted MFS family arabinose efflux permease
MLTVLRRRSFALLWSAGLISITGDWVVLAALPFYMYELTGSALATSTMLLAYIGPQLLFGSMAGVFVDRWDRKRTMVVANLLRGPLMLLMLFATSAETIWVIYAVVFVEGLIGRFFGPAESALLPRLVEEEHLVAANSMNALNDNLARLAGPALGGALLGLVGLPGVVLLDAASYLLSAALIALIAAPRREPEANTEQAGSACASASGAFWREWVEGLRMVWHGRTVRSLLIVLGIAQLADSILSALLVVFVQGVVGAGAPEFGAVLTARGIGGLLGGVIVARLGRGISPARMLSASLASVGVLLMGSVYFPSVPLLLTISLAIGVPVMGWLASSQALLQSSVEDAYLGRLFGTYGTTTALLAVAGIVIAGALGDRIGVVPMLSISGALNMLAGALALVLLGTARKRDAE